MFSFGLLRSPLVRGFSFLWRVFPVGMRVCWDSFPALTFGIGTLCAGCRAFRLVVARWWMGGRVFRPPMATDANVNAGCVGRAVEASVVAYALRTVKESLRRIRLEWSSFSLVGKLIAIMSSTVFSLMRELQASVCRRRFQTFDCPFSGRVMSTNVAPCLPMSTYVAPTKKNRDAFLRRSERFFAVSDGY